MQEQHNAPMPDDNFIKKMEVVINKTIPGLTMFVRDLNLPDEIAEKYKPDTIIREKAFVDASHRVMGMATTHRYGILSNHMASLENLEHGTNWGLCVANRDSRFKVLAVHEYNGKTLILLLHLPDDDDWKMFQNVKINIEEDMIASSIERFENKCNFEAIPELATDEWLKRCSFPIGLNDKGDFFDLE